jgi:4,5-dihydroxyphthalate decarboxylase
MLAKLNVSIAVGDYDRTRPLADGSVAIDGVKPRFLLLSPEEMFFRAFRHADFDVCELSLSSFAVRTARGDNPYIGIPVFPSRAFRHTSIVVRRDRGIESPQDLKGRRIGTPEYQLSACVWARGILQADHGVRPEDIIWVRGGMEDPGRVEKISLNLPPAVRLESAPADRTLSDLLAAGDLDGIIGPRLPSCFADPAANVGWLFRDTIQAASQYFRRTGIFPIMHVIGVRRTLVKRHPWLPATLLKAFNTAKSVALQHLADTSATKVMLPFLEEQLVAARDLLGQDFWSYGFTAGNRQVLDTFLGYHHEQGLSSRRLAAAELFHPGALELYKI